MQFRILTALALACSYVHADTGPLEVVSYPRVCSNVCGPVVTQSQGNCLLDDLDCICIQPHMKQLIPLCVACAKNAQDTQNGEDFYPQVKKLIDTCDLKTTSITLGAAAPTAMPMLGAGAAAVLAVAAVL